MTIALAVLLTFSPMSPLDTLEASRGATCTPWRGTDHVSRIRVFVSHRRGSAVPAHIDRVTLREYVARVMASGAWPARKPWASLQVGAIGIKQYAAWFIAHHQPGYSWHGRCFDIRDGDQLYRPWVDIHHRLVDAVSSTWTVWLRKNGRLIRTGWTGDGGRCGQVVDGWHLREDGVTDCARRGWTWLRIIKRYLAPVQVVRR